jgi:hypothetical protein
VHPNGGRTGDALAEEDTGYRLGSGKQGQKDKGNDAKRIFYRVENAALLIFT